MPKPKLPPRRQIKFYIPEDLFVEMVMLKPELQASVDTMKYGALTTYFNMLIRQDLEKIKARVRAQAQDPGAASS